MGNGPRKPPCPTCGCDGGTATLYCRAMHEALVERAVTADRARIAAAIREEQKLRDRILSKYNPDLDDALDRLLRVVEGG